MQKNWILNTSNQGKLSEFKRLFAQHGKVLHSSEIDLKEIHADPISVVVHKASQIGEGILVEDTSLDIEGAKVGIHVKWLFDHLPSYAGKKADWRVLLAYLKEGSVRVYEGVVHGTIVLPRGEGGFGFDPVFLPDGATKTLAQAKSPEVDARSKAVDALFKEKPIAILPPIIEWNGPWQ